MTALIDKLGRKIEILRISVTDRCNYRCVYCMPETGVPFIPHPNILSYEEIVDITRVAISMGITKFRLTGGEPLVRLNIVGLVEKLSALPGIDELAMTTNGSLLAPLAADLAKAGLDRVNISLDTLDSDRFSEITRGGRIEDVLEGIDAALSAGLTPVKLNIVVTPDDGEQNAERVEAYARKKGLITRRITKMDIRNGIFSVVQNSDRGDCSKCNRLRLTSDGYIRCCLLNDIMFDARQLGAKEAILRAVRAKPECGIGTKVEYMGRIGG